MSRSHDFGWSLPGKLAREVLLELLPAPCAAVLAAAIADDPDTRWGYGACPACGERYGHDDPVRDAAIPPDAVIAALVRRGWAPRVARRWVEYEVQGRRYAHVPHWYGAPLTFRAWRRRNKVLVAQDRADEIERFAYDRGRSYW